MSKRTFNFGDNKGSGTQQNGEFHRVNIYNQQPDDDERKINPITVKLSKRQKGAVAKLCLRENTDKSALGRELFGVALEYEAQAGRLGMRIADFLEEAASFYSDFRNSGQITEAMTRRVITRAMARAILGNDE